MIVSKIQHGVKIELTKLKLRNLINLTPGKLVGFSFVVLHKFAFVRHLENKKLIMDWICNKISFDLMNSSDHLCFMEELGRFSPFCVMKVDALDERLYMAKLENFTRRLFLHVSQKLENDKLIHYNYLNYFKSIQNFIDKLFFKNTYRLSNKNYKNLNEHYSDTVKSYFDTVKSLYFE